MLLKRLFKIIGLCSLILSLALIDKIDYSHNYYDYTYDVMLDFEIPIKEDTIIEEKIEEPKVLYTLNGDLTGYAADCPMCNGTLACKRDYKVYKNGVVSYNDATYGNVRIVASSKKLACGSIVSIESSSVGSIYAIVLDRGVLGNNLDLLVESESYASKYVGRSKISYNVLREGW